MKRILIVMICMLSVVATPESLRSMDSVPGNKNLLNPALLESDVQQADEGVWASITTLSPIPVEQGASHTISLPSSVGGDVSIKLSGNGGSTVYVDESFDEAGGACANPSNNFFECTFEPTHGDLDIEIHGGDGLAQHLYYYHEQGHEYHGFQLEKGTLRTAYTEYEPYVDEPPEIAGEEHLHVSYTANVPLGTILQENIEVHDAIDGEIPTEDLSVKSDAYTGHETTVGSHTVTLEASDSAGNTSTFDLVINVYDNKAPLIDGPDTVEVDVNDAPDANAIIDEHFTFSDGHDGSIGTHAITEDTHTDKRSDTGEGSVTFEVMDESGNITSHTFTVAVKDYDAPAITGADALTITQSDMRTLESIFAEYSVSDNHDDAGDVTFTIDGGDYTTEAASGTYELTLQATDSAANSSGKTVTITVVDDIAPKLYGLSTERISYTESFDPDDYIASMTVTDNDDSTLDNAAIIHAGTDYVEGEVGTYTHTFEAADASGNTATHTLTLNVIDDVAPVFSTVSSVLVTTDDPLNEDTIQSMLVSDGSLEDFKPVSYTVLEDGYSRNTDKEGEYLYTVEYSNAKGEKTLRSIEIQVASITEDEPTVPYGLVASIGGLMLAGIAVWIKRRR